MGESGIVLGIDGGGTKTAAWLSTVEAGTDDRPLGRGIVGPGNPRAVGFENAFANIDLAIEHAFQDAAIPRTKVRAACLALAGADRRVERDRLAKWCADKFLAEHIVLTNDADPLLAAASADNWGVALISGTGSFAFGRNQTGQTARCGGWGYLIGDEGSGYDIALAGLQAAARAADGRSPVTELLEKFQQRLQVANPQGLIEAIYRPDTSRQQIAELADVVFDADRSGDEVARRIVHAAATELAELVRTLVSRLQLPTGQFPLAIAGGTLLHQPRLQTEVQQQLTSDKAVPGSVALVPDPVRGAVILARRTCTS